MTTGIKNKFANQLKTARLEFETVFHAIEAIFPACCQCPVIILLRVFVSRGSNPKCKVRKGITVICIQFNRAGRLANSRPIWCSSKGTKKTMSSNKAEIIRLKTMPTPNVLGKCQRCNRSTRGFPRYAKNIAIKKGVKTDYLVFKNRLAQ